MPASFEYAVIRVVPRVDREEFLNAGVILFSLESRFLKAVVQLDEKRLRALAPDADLLNCAIILRAFEKVSRVPKMAARFSFIPARAVPLAGGAAQHRDSSLAGACRVV